MSDEFTDVVIELASIVRELGDLDPGATERRVALRERQRELRVRAAELRDAQPVDEANEAELRRRLKHLEQLRDNHRGGYLSPSAAASTGMGGGIEPRDVHSLHRQMDEAFGLADIEEEIRRLQARLDR